MNTSDKVEQLLKNNTKLRDSDTWLLFAYWEQEGLKLTDDQKRALANLTTAETITRVRRKLRDKYPGSEAVEKARYTKYIEARDEYGMPYMKEILGGS